MVALDRIRAEFRSDTESLAQSEAALSLPDDGAFADGVSLTPTYQRGSQITLGRSNQVTFCRYREIAFHLYFVIMNITANKQTNMPRVL